MRVRVNDPGRGFEPTRPAPRAGGTAGWGLHLVDRVADRWGVESENGAGVCLEIDRGSDPGGSDL